MTAARRTDLESNTEESHMHLGVAIFPTDHSVRPDVLARAAEDAGFESLWVPEHTHMPVDHSPWPGGSELPDEYRRTLDPFVALTAAASATTTLKLATGICLVAQHDPIVLAKQTATLDLLSGGRFIFGVGYGWNRPEAEHHGTAFEARRDTLRERVLAVQALWTEDEASFDGEHVSFAPSWSWPKPVQEPHPPVLLGAALGERTLREIVEFADGWMPIGASAAEEGLPQLRRAAEDHGRDPDSLSVTVYGTRPDPERLAALAEIGVERTVLWLPSADEGEALDVLERYTGLLREVA